MMARILTVLLAVAISGCNLPASKSRTEQKQGVEGIVSYKPDYDHSDVQFAQNPPDLTPRPLPGATVYMIEYKQQEIHQLNSKEILDTVISDSLGRYRLLTAPGIYYLAVGKSDFPSVVYQYNPDDTIGLNFPVHVVSVIEIPAGRVILHDFEIHELVAQ